MEYADRDSFTQKHNSNQTESAGEKTMDKKEITQLVMDLIAAQSCCADLKAAGQKWLDAAATDQKKAAADALLQEIREDIATIEHVIDFFESPQGKRIFGEEKAAAIAAHAREVKANGGKWCDCPACTACLKILDNASLLF